ncbi:MAG TPA: hypothetical protein VLF14_04615 [Candidatus Binatia bacterium]|nr:hypothetical protein [Candidatus Binatia bacterium]
MRHSRNLVSVLAAVGVAGLMAVSACKSSDESQLVPGESRPGLTQPAPQGNMPVAPERSTGDTGGPKGGY